MPSIHHISSRQHPIVKYWIKLRDDRQFRYVEKRVLIEGKKLVQEIGLTFPPKRLIVVNESLIPDRVIADEIVIVTEEVMEKISGVKSPEGVLAEMAMPPERRFSKVNKLLACDGINDPGNLGTLLRTAWALGWQGAFLLDNCCDPYNEKALRAAKGATFHVPIQQGSWQQLRQIISENKLTCYVADLQGQDVKRLDSKQPSLLVLCNEASGPSAITKQACHPICIPMNKQVESLNVAAAGAILMYQLRPTDE